jgi:hypothetical protein
LKQSIFNLFYQNCCILDKQQTKILPIPNPKNIFSFSSKLYFQSQDCSSNYITWKIFSWRRLIIVFMSLSRKIISKVDYNCLSQIYDAIYINILLLFTTKWWAFTYAIEYSSIMIICSKHYNYLYLSGG